MGVRKEKRTAERIAKLALLTALINLMVAVVNLLRGK